MLNPAKEWKDNKREAQNDISPNCTFAPVNILGLQLRDVKSYDMKPDEGSNWVRQGDESESAKIVLKQVKWTFIYAYLWQTMWNHAKKSMEGPKLSDSVFYNGTPGALCWKRPKNTKTWETKTQITQFFEKVWPI